ncbi:hypothetical protein QR77_23890 [Streptomyces sp. 150FB]|uniref:tetratricopeptide repeat protein n=1 Tax=Streptomyces sp. 150FB TaxID=1576605 RepID=UPI0005895DD4|nr:hypothetical protein [Streptomyces sp. 150FB]KIF76101.1 hypothetical protein QR77_23890 [Streptomyces sp. 150FB]
MPRITLLRQLLEAGHLTTYKAFEAQFSRAARRLATEADDPRLASVVVSSRQFDRWMSGELKNLPRPDTCRILEQLLGRAARELFALAPSERDTPAQAPAEISLVPAAGTVADDENPVDIITRARQLSCGNADEATLALLASQLDEITDRYELDGPRGLSGQTKSLRKLGHTLLAGQQPPSARRDLFRITARAGGLLGYMAVNTGNFPLAEAYCAEALELSRAIGDLDTELWAGGTLSFALYYSGRYDDADAQAAATVDRSPDHPQAIRLLVNGRARALAKLGDRKRTEQVIGQAMDLSDRHDVAPGLTSCISFAPYGRARTLANAVTARVALKDAVHVLREADRLDDLIEKSDSAWSRSLVRLDVATALLQQRAPDVEHAMALGREAIAFAAPLPISSVRQRSRDLYERAAPWQSRPAVREYGEQLRAWGCRTSPATAG